MVKDEKGDLLAESYNISNRWKQLLNVHEVSDARQREIIQLSHLYLSLDLLRFRLQLEIYSE
jgi:hypothetical protein